MELTLRLIGIALSCFAMGFSLCGFLYTYYLTDITDENEEQNKEEE